MVIRSCECIYEKREKPKHERKLQINNNNNENGIKKSFEIKPDIRNALYEKMWHIWWNILYMSMKNISQYFSLFHHSMLKTNNEWVLLWHRTFFLLKSSQNRKITKNDWSGFPILWNYWNTNVIMVDQKFFSNWFLSIFQYNQ